MCLAPPSCGVPMMRRVRVPMPSILAPALHKNRVRSCTSGSVAAPRSTVIPFAHTAAISSVSLAPTLGNRNVMSAPCRPRGARRKSDAPFSSTCAPIWARPFRCISMGRAPNLQPPGRPTQARAARTSIGARKNSDERMARMSSGGTVLPGSLAGSTSITPCLLYTSRCV